MLIFEDLLERLELGRIFVGIVLVSTHEIITRPLKTPKDLNACVTCYMPSCSLRKWFILGRINYLE